MKAKIFALWIIFFMFGAALGQFFFADPWFYLLFSVFLILISFVLFSNKFVWALICAVACFLLAVSLFQFQNEKYNKLNSEYADQTLSGIATISGLPVETERGQQAEIDFNDTKLIAYFRPFPKLLYGSIIDFSGKVKCFSEERRGSLIKNKVAGEANIQNFKIIGQNHQLRYRIKDILFLARQKFNESLAKLLPNEEAGLASGLILGEKSLVTPELKRMLQATGTTHIIALSGYNITIILGLFLFLRQKASRLANLLLPLVVVLFFVIMTGGAASVVRASIMGFMPLLARYFGRPKNATMAILFSALIMIAVNPFVLLYDPGFQLSFVAMAGLIYITPVLTKLFRVSSISGQILAETIGAQLAVLPLIIYYFGVVSVISPLSNLIILMLIPLAMLAAFILGLAGLIFLPLGQVLALPGYLIFKAINLTIYNLGRLPFASKQLKFDILWAMIYYLVIADFMLIFKRRNSGQKEETIGI